ncbi:MAG: hypothetical protein OXH20_12640 [bacterium]|nr:hypothetical protein [bacterium]MDE0668810.1 hypothetical protein [bacterium]MYB23708.1 hypothetical protein [Acidimicrobiia bacterium]
MDTDIALAAKQLARLRAMNSRYHHRFFADIRYSILAGGAAFVLGAATHPWLFAAAPVVALIGACTTAFHAYYLIFSRQYAARLEVWLRHRTGSPLVAHRLEESYLFPLDRRKIVTLAPGPGFTWFGFMTGFYTIVGAAAYAGGVILVATTVFDAQHGTLSAVLGGLYLGALGILTLASLAVGRWWFVKGEGERRLREILDEEFGPPA